MLNLSSLNPNPYFFMDVKPPAFILGKTVVYLLFQYRLSSEQEIENSLEDTSEANPVVDSPIPPRPVTPLGSVSSHVSLPRLSESPHLTRSRRCSVEEHSTNLSASLRKSSLSHNNEEKFLPSISPARSISNPEKQTSLRTR